MEHRQYLCIDGRSFFASVECAARSLDPLETDLVVADPERSENTICLAVSVHLKTRGVKNRCRLREIPPQIQPIIAPPRMQLYIDYAAEIYGVYLNYLAPEDIYIYSIDEAFLDVTPYLKMYGTSAEELGRQIMADVKDTVGTICTCGVGTNLYLAKIALDLLAKHDPQGIAVLDEARYRALFWEHRPITDFWRISTGTAEKLRRHGITTLRQIACCDEELLYEWFGIDAELLIDHAWGREPTTIADIKNYKSKGKSLSHSQVLMRDYAFAEGEVIAKEMADAICLELSAGRLTTDSVTLYVGYTHAQNAPAATGTAKFVQKTNLSSEIVPAVAALYRRVVNPSVKIRRVGLCCNQVTEDPGTLQLSLYEDPCRQIRHQVLQETLVAIRARYGKNAILKGINFLDAATGRERNRQIGGHKSGTD